MRKRLGGLLAGSALLAAGVGGGVAFASIPDANGVVHACYLNLTGVVTVIDSASASCTGLQTAISWPTSAVHGVHVVTWAPTEPADAHGTGFVDESFDCPSGEFPLSGSAFYAQNAGINLPMSVDGFHVVSGVAVGMIFQMQAWVPSPYTMQVQVECALAS